MIKYVCDMCGEELHKEEVISLHFEVEHRYLMPPESDLHLCTVCAIRVCNFIACSEGGTHDG